MGHAGCQEKTDGKAAGPCHCYCLWAVLADGLCRSFLQYGFLYFRQKHKSRLLPAFMFLAEDMGLEPTGLLHLTPFPWELLSHSVNPPKAFPGILINTWRT